MFVECTTRVEASLSQVEKSLDRVRANLEEWADIAYREGEQLRARVGPTAAIAREVSMKIGIAEIHRTGLVYPIQWKASDAGLLFPELNADLILSKAGSNVTYVTLRGTYQPPMGPFGRLVDRAVLGRVADATVADWVERLGSELSSQSSVR